MTTPIHTPYDGSSRLFQIGLKTLDLRDWIDVDDGLRDYLDEKDRLAARVPHDIFAALPQSLPAQAEVLALLADHLPERFPDIYARIGPQIDIIPAFRRVRLDDPLIPPLLIAAGLVQEDLVIMQKDGDWRLVAGAVAFPSSWRLRDKVGRAMHEVHAPVPGFNAGTRNAGLIARMFDNLKVEQPVIRWNWSIYGDDALHHPHNAPPRRFGDGEVADKVFLRLERQTLRKLPQTGAILFTVRIYVDPLERLESRPEGAVLARAIGDQVAELDTEQLAYKGLTQERERLLALLAAIGG